MFKQRGLSLVELMISLTLGIVLMTGVVQMFLASRITYGTQQGISRVQESGRMAVEFLSQDIRMAGFMGCSSRNLNIQNGLRQPANAFFFDPVGRGIEGYTAENLPEQPTGITLVPQSDVLVIRRASADGFPIVGPTGATANLNLADDANNDCMPGRLLCSGDVALVSDCVNGRIFQVTNLQDIGGGGTSVVHAVSAGQPPGGNQDAQLGGQQFPAGSQVVAVNTFTYFVAPSSFNNQVNSLWQRQGDSPPVELVEGIADMRVTYGVDTDSDDVPDDYRRENTVTDWEDVSAVRINLLLQSLEANILPEPQPFEFDGVAVDVSDRRIRQVFTTTIGIRNRLP